MKASPLWTGARIGLIVLGLLAFVYGILAAVPMAYGNVPAPRDVLMLTERIPHSENLEAVFRRKMAEMRLRLGLMGCQTAIVSEVEEKNVTTLTLICQKGR